MNTLFNYATTVATLDGTTTVTYHSTPIVIFNDEFIQLNTGGWFSSTTKRKMNQVSNDYNLGYSVYQRKGVWYVDTPQGYTLEFTNGNTIRISRDTHSNEHLRVARG